MSILKSLTAWPDKLADKVIKRIDVTGHTDNVRIAPRSRDIHADNTALSLARAKSVGRYPYFSPASAAGCTLPERQRDKEPVATNNTAAGRALNRRVEVKITAFQRVETTELKLIKERSGVEKLETVGVPAQGSRNEVPRHCNRCRCNQEE